MASSDNSPAAIPPRPGSDPGIEIAPQLESVLQNLNVNLEDELIRYRRQRHGRVPPPPPPRRAAQRQTIDLISVSASSPSDAVRDVEPSAPADGLNQSPPPPPPNPFLNQTPDPDGPLTESVELAADLESLIDIAETSTQIENELDSELPEPATGSALPIHTTDTSPDGYLESSEELLKSIADEQTEPADVPEPYSPNKKNNSLLKLAGLVLVLLAGIGVGFAVTYPSQLQRLRSQLWPTGTEAPSSDDATSAEVSEPATTTPETATDGYNPPGPDLSTREFVELDLESLSTLELESATGSSPLPGTSLPNNPAQSPLPAPAATPTPAGQPTPAASPTNPPTTSPTATPPTTAPEATASAAPGAGAAAAPAAPAIAATTAPTAATGSNFYVVTSYTGDASLNKARTLVPDAFVRNFKTGARIQLAAFDNQAQAEDQVAFLTQQGATVELVGPTNE